MTDEDWRPLHEEFRRFARLGRLRNRLEVSNAVAELASRHLGEPGRRYAEPGPPVAGGMGA